jgi:thioredoxin 1
MRTVNEGDFDSAISDAKKLTLIDFWAEWCGPCKMLMPIIEELSNEMTEINMYKCNVDEAGKIAERFGIQSIPTLILFKTGEVVDRRVGGSSKATLKEWIDSKLRK